MLGVVNAISRLRTLRDVNLTGLDDGETLVWDAATSKFVAGSVGGGGSISVLEAYVNTGPSPIELSTNAILQLDIGSIVGDTSFAAATGGGTSLTLDAGVYHWTHSALSGSVTTAPVCITINVGGTTVGIQIVVGDFSGIQLVGGFFALTDASELTINIGQQSPGGGAITLDTAPQFTFSKLG